MDRRCFGRCPAQSGLVESPSGVRPSSAYATLKHHCDERCCGAGLAGSPAALDEFDRCPIRNSLGAISGNLRAVRFLARVLRPRTPRSFDLRADGVEPKVARCRYWSMQARLPIPGQLTPLPQPPAPPSKRHSDELICPAGSLTIRGAPLRVVLSRSLDSFAASFLAFCEPITLLISVDELVAQHLHLRANHNAETLERVVLW